MFNHVMVGSNDIERSKRFYDAVLGVLGAPAGFANQGPSGHQRVFYRHAGNSFGISQPINGEPACHANGGTIGFYAKDADAVQAFHDAGVAAGGRAIEDPPGERQGPFGPMVLAYLRDPAGNKICAMHRKSA